MGGGTGGQMGKAPFCGDRLVLGNGPLPPSDTSDGARHRPHICFGWQGADGL